MVMTRNRMLKLIDTARIEQAIEQAEENTSIEICVSLSRFFLGNVRKAAENTFTRLRIAKTAHRTGILIFIVPSRRQFVILGDCGVNAKVDPEFWVEIAGHMSKHFQNQDFTGAIILGLELIRTRLSLLFPVTGESNPNEIPNKVDL